MFPPLPSGNNPYVGAAAEAGSGAAHLAAALREASVQQAALKQRQQAAQVVQQHQDQQDLFRAVQDGWTPADTITQDPSGLKVRKPATENQDQSRVMNIGGQRMYKPTEQESGKSFVPQGQLAEALKSAGWDGKQPITPEHTHSLMQALNEAQPKDEAYDIDTTGKFKDSKGNPVPVAIGKKSKNITILNMGGSQGGPFAAKDTPEGSEPDGNPQQPGMSFSLPEKADKPDAQSILPNQRGPNGGLLVFNKNSQSVEEVPIPKGSKAVMTAGQEEADKDRHEREADREDARKQRKADADQRIADKFTKDHDNLQGLEQTQWSLHGAFADAAQTPNGRPISQPRMVNGQMVQGGQVIMDDAHRKAFQAQADLAKKQAMKAQDGAKKIRQRFGWGEFEQGGNTANTATPNTANTATSKSAAPQTAAPAKKYSAREISDWAKANGKDPGDALTRAKKNGIL